MLNYDRLYLAYFRLMILKPNFINAYTKEGHYMPVIFGEFKQDRKQTGLNLQVISGIPSPWTEAVKGILYIKHLPYIAIKHDPFNEEQNKWFGSNTAPALKANASPGLINWLDILNYLETQSPTPTLFPLDNHDKEIHLSLCHDICSKLGLGWNRRLQSVHQGLSGNGGFPLKIAHYLAVKYEYFESAATLYDDEVNRILTRLKTHLFAQRAIGSPYYIQYQLTALDIYSAVFMAYFKPLENAICPMYPSIRTAFESYNDDVARALDPILFEHRDFIYQEHLELPLSL